jgi:serine/threonine-protein kinase
VTRDDIVLGTPDYLSPEALRTPDRIDARSDIYALGATAYYLLTGTPVFDGALSKIFADHISTPPVPPSVRSGRSIPDCLEALVLSALAKNPDDRPESVAVFDERLAGCRDVPPWTEADAAAWWRTRGARILAARGGEAPLPKTSEPITVAMAGRN